VEKLTKAISPDLPFRFSFTKEEYQHRFSEFSDASLMISIFGGMTIFISCLGLFGLSGFVAEKRSKEMSIRKVFGASASRILISLSQDFLKPVAYALLLVIPASILIARSLLSNITYRVALSWWMFASGGIATLIIALLIVFYHGWRTAQENPVVRLKNE
jgi:putative ABC transport system permease protein